MPSASGPSSRSATVHGVRRAWTSATAATPWVPTRVAAAIVPSRILVVGGATGLIGDPTGKTELRKLLTTGYLFDGPAAVRYPRGSGPNHPIDPDLQPVEIGKGVVRRSGGRVALLVFGVQLAEAMKVAESLDATVVDMRFVKPLDEALVRELAGSHELLVTIEENAVMGGAGSAVGEFLASEGLEVPLLQLGLPDYYVEHAKPSEMLAECGLDAAGIEKAVRQRLDRQ